MIGEPDCAGERFGVTTERSCMQKNIVTDPVLLVTENDTGLNNGCGLQSDKGSKFRRVKLSDEARGRPLLRHSRKLPRPSKTRELLTERLALGDHVGRLEGRYGRYIAV